MQEATTAEEVCWLFQGLGLHGGAVYFRRCREGSEQRGRKVRCSQIHPFFSASFTLALSRGVLSPSAGILNAKLKQAGWSLCVLSSWLPAAVKRFISGDPILSPFHYLDFFCLFVAQEKVKGSTQSVSVNSEHLVLHCLGLAETASVAEQPDSLKKK